MHVRPAIATCWDIDNDLGRNKCYTPKTRLKFKRHNVIALIKTSLIWALSRENLFSVVCDQVRHKQVCSATRTSEMLETLVLATIGIILSKQWTKMLTRLCGCTVWSEPLLFIYGIKRFSHDVAHLIPFKLFIYKKFNPNWHFRGLVQDWRSIFYFRHSWSAIFHFHNSHCNKTRIVYT